MPEILPEPPPGSLVLSTNSAGPIAGAIVLLAVGALAVVGVATTTWALAIIALAVLTIGSFVMRNPLDALFRWRSPELILPASTLPLGGSLDLVYRRQARKVTDVSRSQVTVTLRCEERATYRKGTQARTDSAEVFRHRFVGEVEGAAWGFEAVVPIHVPLDAGAPTMNLRYNEVRWTLETEVDGATVPSDKHRFDVVVAPVLAPAAYPRVQDS